MNTGMTPFLYNVAELFYRTYGSEINKLAFVFPNRRAGLFFQKYLSLVSDKPLFSPKIFTINDILFSFTEYRPSDRINMLFILYKEYIEISGSDESFDDFLFWGEMLLNDFDDIDKYMVNAKQLFTNIKEEKEIDEQFDYLSENQIKAIRRFWKNFRKGKESDKKEQFLIIWKILYPLYTRLRTCLRDSGTAYEGMAFREIAEKAKAREDIFIPYEQIVFVGLNALTLSEETVLKYLKNIGKADFYWDYDIPAVQDMQNKASFFVKQNTLLFPSKHALPQQEILPFPEIEVIGIPSVVGQTKQAGTLLSELIKRGDIPNPAEAIDTAVILPDEKLLLPMMYSVPEEISKINVTMGYALSNTSVAGFVDILFDLQKFIRFQSGKALFYHKEVLMLLAHRYIQTGQEEHINELIKNIKRQNKVYISVDDLGGNELLNKIFVPIESPTQAADYILSVFECLQQIISEQKSRDNNNERSHRLSLEKEFLYHYYITVKRLKEVILEHNVTMAVATFWKLLQKMALSISIPFQGEPLSGLQIMGVLETRTLDFENMIILSMNEGIFPLKKAANSFIPYNLRKGFGLSTTEHQDSIYAYYFYRMIYRAKKIYFIYDTRTEGLKTGEVSRYIYQLDYLYNAPVKYKQSTFDIAVGSLAKIKIDKTGHAAEQLKRFLEGGDRQLSASAINTYLSCPLRFYIQYVEGLREEDEVSEALEFDTFGSVFHKVMELIYARAEGHLVDSEWLKKVEKDPLLLTSYIESAFASELFKTDKVYPLEGQNYLTGEIIRKYVKQVLKKDLAITPFLYIKSEKKMLVEYPFQENQKVRLKCVIDRVQEKDGVTQIFDYKTGAEELTFKSVETLFDRTSDTRPKGIMQVFLYSLLYLEQEKVPAVVPGIYALKQIFKPDFDWHIYYKPDREGEIVSDYSKMDGEFRIFLNQLISEIFDFSVPFVQTEQIKNCKYCICKSICNR